MKVAMATKTSVDFYLNQPFLDLVEWIDIVRDIQKESNEEGR